MRRVVHLFFRLGDSLEIVLIAAGIVLALCWAALIFLA
jgi:hypothetical protein